MPLEKSSSKPAFVRNLKEELKTKPRDQALAIAYSIKRKARKDGGKVHVGPIVGDTGGRADKVPMSVPDGSYVVPADIVSGIGEGNSLHGLKIIDRMFPRGKAAGGKTDAVPIAAADGESVIGPDQLKTKFGGDLDHAHKCMDAWVKHERQKIIHTMSRLPGPAQD